MAKYSGIVGYVLTEETRPGVFVPVVKERKMRGDVLALSKRYDGGDKVNENISLNHRISLIGDPFAFENFIYLKYVTYMGVRWEVSSVEVQKPRLILSMGGVYNVQATGSTGGTNQILP